MTVREYVLQHIKSHYPEGSEFAQDFESCGKDFEVMIDRGCFLAYHEDIEAFLDAVYLYVGPDPTWETLRQAYAQALEAAYWMGMPVAVKESEDA